jgi:hypothetical protein
VNNYRIIWTNESLDDLLNIEEFLGNNAYADKMIDKLLLALSNYKHFLCQDKFNHQKAQRSIDT